MKEIIVDNFAGGGGASLGIFIGTGRHPDIAVNHDALALEMHKANHPETLHLCENVWAVKPREATTVEGHDYQIVDIGLRMLTPRELARAQGFPDSYILTGSKSNQVAKIGNSVCPPVAAAIAGANYRETRRVRETA